MKLKIAFFALFLAFFATKSTAQPTPKLPPFSIDELEKRTFDFFWKLADQFAQTPDRWPSMEASSVAATGFGLTAYCIGVHRGYVSRAEAAARARACLQFLIDAPQNSKTRDVAGFRGFFYHFLLHKNGRRWNDCELSTVDTAWLMAGILSAQAFFDQNSEDEKTVRDLAERLYRRVEWDWAADVDGVISMGWHPEKAFKSGPTDEKSGFLESEWRGYNEAMMIYFLALGSPTHPVSEKAWAKWLEPYKWEAFEGFENAQFGPLFGHQWSQMYVDFRGVKDDFMRSRWSDYFENSRRATLSNRAFCIRNPKKWAGYSDKIWGLTACDGPGKKAVFNGKEQFFDGYSARGAASDYLVDDGTITPCAAGGSIPFAPTECLDALRAMWEKFPADSLVGEFGFKDAFNESAGWFDVDYLGIDQGAILLQLENYRSGFVWNLIKKSPHIVAGMRKAGFRGGWLDGHERPEDLFSKEVFKSKNGGELPYRELRIEGFRNADLRENGQSVIRNPPIRNQKLPLVIFLHGAGERGFDNETPLKNAILAFAEPDFQKKWPCRVIAPQCPNDGWWSTFLPHRGMAFSEEKPTEPMRLLIELIEKMRADPTVDLEKIYVVGLSMGGFGTFELVWRRPDWFAAAMPVCSGAPPDFAAKIKAVPTWIFHGQQDAVVPVELSRDIFSAMKKAGGEPKYTEFSTLGHACWQEVFYNERHLEWLFSQKRR